MSDCNETIRELHAYLDGELAADVHAHITAHLDGCMDCLQAFDFQAELKAVIRRKCSNDELPEGLVKRIELCFDDRLDASPDANLDANLDDDGIVGHAD